MSRLRIKRRTKRSRKVLESLALLYRLNYAVLDMSSRIDALVAGEVEPLDLLHPRNVLLVASDEYTASVLIPEQTSGDPRQRAANAATD